MSVSETPETAPVASGPARAPDAGLVPPGQEVSERNPATPADVNGDGYVSPIDALRVIGYLNDPASARPSAVPDTSAFYLDANRDGTISASDALLVIAHLSSDGAGTVDGEGEATASLQLVSDQRAAVPMPTVSVADARSIDFSLQRQVSSHVADRTFFTVGDDASMALDNIELPGLLDGNPGHSMRRVAASLPSSPARERDRRESEIAVDRYFGEL